MSYPTPDHLAAAAASSAPRPDLPTLLINRRRLWASLMELKEIGAYDDDATGLRGVCRLALTDADEAARRRCVKWMLEAGLDVRVDRIGNVYASRPGSNPSPVCADGLTHRRRARWRATSWCRSGIRNRSLPPCCQFVPRREWMDTVNGQPPVER